MRHDLGALSVEASAGARGTGRLEHGVLEGTANDVIMIKRFGHVCNRSNMPECNGHEDSLTAKSVLPFLKWPGGKRWLVPALLTTIRRSEFRTYYEPFLGGGALFFALKPVRAVLSDINYDLINTYRQVKCHPSDLIRRLQTIPVNKRTYNSQRKHLPRRVLDRAVRFLYLNRTAFGGMYRLNQTGEFNVPFGGGERSPAPLWKSGLLRKASRALRSSKLEVCDFEGVLNRAGSGDLVYCDPTYTVAHNNNGFIRYNEKTFSWADQNRLARCCHEAAGRGATVIVTNAFHLDILKLFDPPRHFIVSRHSRLCPRVEYRNVTEEYLFVFPSECRSHHEV